jgi:hypothetical protein
MTNHPNRARLPYKVWSDKVIATFHDYPEAMLYAQSASVRLGHLEVTAPSGLVGQYSKGETTDEFRHHHDSVMKHVGEGLVAHG